MRNLKNILVISLLLCMLAAFTGCGKAEAAQPLKDKNKLPENGIVTQEQMETIAGKEGVFEFYSEDEGSGIKYSWYYDGTKIQNPVEQKLKVSFTQEKVNEVKKLANDASVGLGIKLENMAPAAPLELKLTLPELWEADSVILCKLIDGKPAKMADVEIDGTTLTFPVTETGDTYYLVGGETEVKASDGSDVQEVESGKSAGVGKKEQTGQEVQKNPGVQKKQTVKSDSSKKAVTASKPEHTCTISIDCISLSKHMDKLRTKEKAAFVPKDGWLLYASEIEYTPGESAYDVLNRACKRAGYQMEASYTPIYGSYYIEGINQLYEFDAGELSGWMYSVNGWYPNYGCSSYEVKDGDKIRFRYTCDLGKDIGGGNAVQ